MLLQKVRRTGSWENGRKMYSELSTETKEFFEFMMKYDLMDLNNKKNKQAGGY
jgi:oligoendopeptidase F